MDKKEKNLIAVIMGRAGGLKGGPARIATTTPERRREIAAMGGKAHTPARGKRIPKHYRDFLKVREASLKKQEEQAFLDQIKTTAIQEEAARFKEETEAERKMGQMPTLADLGVSAKESERAPT